MLPRYLSEDNGAEMLAISDQFSVFYAALSKKAIRNEEMLFPLRPKLHAMQEVAYIQSEECFLVLIECLRLRHFLVLVCGPNKCQKFSVISVSHSEFRVLSPILPGYNHRFYQGYKPEDFIGRMVTVCQAANNSTVAHMGLKRFYLG